MASEVNSSAPEIHLIGEIAVGFGNLELYLELGIWQLLAGDDEQTRKLGEAITAEMSFDRKVHAFASLCRLRVPAGSDDTELQALVRISSRCRGNATLFCTQLGRAPRSGTRSRV